MTTLLRGAILAGIVASLLPNTCWGQKSPDSVVASSLEQLSLSLQQVIRKVSPAIVEVEVVGYRRVDDDDDDTSGEKRSNYVLTRKHSSGSGVIMDSEGYIITNAHVVEGATLVRVRVDEKVPEPQGRVIRRVPKVSFDAKVVGTFAEADLALLKIEATGLPTISLANSDYVRSGQLVFAIGSPEGLRNSASMGVISATGRGSENDDGPSYIQTDAAINPGSSGGALVDVNGNLVGITSFSVTENGGSIGLGFALPSKLVYSVFQELKSKARVDYGDIGIKVQNITPTLAAGLRLSQDWGINVSDITPGSSAEKAGVQNQDILLTLDAIPLVTSQQFVGAFYSKRVGDRVQLELLRGTRRLSVEAVVVHHESHSAKSPDAAEIERGIVSKLGVVCSPLDQVPDRSAAAPRPRVGVRVVAKLAGEDTKTELMSGDVIRSVNGTEVTSVDGLRSAIDSLASKGAVVLQIERRDQLRYISFDAN